MTSDTIERAPSDKAMLEAFEAAATPWARHARLIVWQDGTASGEAELLAWSEGPTGYMRRRARGVPGFEAEIAAEDPNGVMVSVTTHMLAEGDIICLRGHYLRLSDRRTVVHDAADRAAAPVLAFATESLGKLPRPRSMPMPPEAQIQGNRHVTWMKVLALPHGYLRPRRLH